MGISYTSERVPDEELDESQAQEGQISFERLGLKGALYPRKGTRDLAARNEVLDAVEAGRPHPALVQRIQSALERVANRLRVDLKTPEGRQRALSNSAWQTDPAVIQRLRFHGDLVWEGNLAKLIPSIRAAVEEFCDLDFRDHAVNQLTSLLGSIAQAAYLERSDIDAGRDSYSERHMAREIDYYHARYNDVPNRPTQRACEFVFSSPGPSDSDSDGWSVAVA